MFYNLYVAESVTRQGKSYLACSIMLFESLFANNVKFNSLNEAIAFISHIVDEKPTRQFDDKIVLNHNITPHECFFKLMTTVDIMLWIPTEKEMTLLWERIISLSQQDLNRIYYKNNLYSFCDVPYMMNLIIKILSTLDQPFMSPYKVPPEIKSDMDLFTDLIKEYVYYQYPYIDKLDRINYMKRDIVAIANTDSTMITFDGWYNFILSRINNMDFKINHVRRDHYMCRINPEGAKREICRIIDPNINYDILADEFIDNGKRNIGVHIIPKDNLRYSIINIMVYVAGVLVIDYLDKYCTIMGSNRKDVQCRIVMKNEFFFNSILLTEGIKNYAATKVLENGREVPDTQESKLVVAGLNINKSVLPEKIKQEFQTILYEDVLQAVKIDQVGILKKLILIEKDIVRSIMAKEKTYYKPDNISPINSYKKNPLEVNGIVAALIYNELKDPDMPMINLKERNQIYKIELIVTKANVDLIKDKFPEVYERFIALLQHPKLGAKLNIIGFPMDVDVPDWILSFVNIQEIVNTNLKNFPLDSIGLMRLDNDNVNYSNIIAI